jgi:uncharacterized membrane protein YhhN
MILEFALLRSQRHKLTREEMTIIILTILAIISALIHMWGEYQGPPLLIYIFKPLTMVLIIIIAVLVKTPPSSRYKYAIIAGCSSHWGETSY